MKKRILIVDDEQLFLNSLQRELRIVDNDFDIYTTTKSKDTLELIEKLNIDLLITDILMPDKEGLEIVREVHVEFPSVKIIAMTGGDIGYLEYANRFGAAYTLSKPFSGEDLIAAINAALHS